MASAPKLSVVIPVYNEEQVLPTLFERLYPALDKLGIAYECVFVNDGSKDRSAALLRQQFQRRPARDPRGAVPCQFRPAFGGDGGSRPCARRLRDHPGCRSAESARGDRQAGRACSTRAMTTSAPSAQQRQDSLWRRSLSKGVNKLREWITPVRITDQGCMMRGYSRSVVAALNETREVNTFIPALASLYAMNPDRGADRARGAPCGTIEVLALQPDPAEFRSDHRILGGAAAAVLHGRHGDVVAVRAAGGRVCSCAA